MKIYFSPVVFALLAAALLLPTNAFANPAPVSYNSFSEFSTLWFAVAALVAGGLIFRKDSTHS